VRNCWHLNFSRLVSIHSADACGTAKLFYFQNWFESSVDACGTTKLIELEKTSLANSDRRVSVPKRLTKTCLLK